MKEKIEKAKNNNLEIELSKNSAKGITLISLAISRKCVRYEERA